MKKSKPAKATKPRPIADDKLDSVVGGAGTGINTGPHPNPPIGPGG